MIMHRGEQTLAIRALKSAAPYIRMYKGKTFVVKAGGGVFADVDSTRVLIEQIGILHYFGVRVVVVHGGGPQLTEMSEALGVSTRMVQGRRVTDEKSIDVTTTCDTPHGFTSAGSCAVRRAMPALSRIEPSRPKRSRSSSRH